MRDFIERIIVERDELKKKRTKLWAFLFSAGIDAVEQDQQKLLKEQCNVMAEYINILNARLKLLGVKGDK